MTVLVTRTVGQLYFSYLFISKNNFKAEDSVFKRKIPSFLAD